MPFPMVIARMEFELAYFKAAVPDFTHHTSYYEVHTISFQTFFEWAFKIVVDS